MLATNIDEVLAQLEALIDDCVKTDNRIGYFAALYFKVTSRIKQGIDNGEFNDGPRMERLDVLFANRYLQALGQWKNKEEVSSSWKIAFSSTDRSSLLVLQQLLLGINAHINLDLGIATVETAQGGDIKGIRNDFEAINMILSSFTYQLLNEMGRISPLLSLLGLHSTNYNSMLIQFTIDNARDGAWCFAEILSQKSGEEFKTCVASRDKQIMQLGEGLIHANFFLKITLWMVHLFEWKKPSKIINVLLDNKKTYFQI